MNNINNMNYNSNSNTNTSVYGSNNGKYIPQKINKSISAVYGNKSEPDVDRDGIIRSLLSPFAINHSID